MYLSVKQSCADKSGVVTELGGNYFCLNLCVNAVSLALNHLSQRNEQILFLVAYSAADANHIGLEGVDDIRNARREIEYILVDDLLRGLVSGAHGVKRGSTADTADVVVDEIPHDGVGVVAHGVLCLTDKRGCGGIALPAASASAGAGLAVRDDDI